MEILFPSTKLSYFDDYQEESNQEFSEDVNSESSKELSFSSPQPNFSNAIDSLKRFLVLYDNMINGEVEKTDQHAKKTMERKCEEMEAVRQRKFYSYVFLTAFFLCAGVTAFFAMQNSK